MSRRGGTKHCCWGLCNSDSRYPERLPEGTFFIPFPKPGKVRDTMTVLERELAELRTHKAKRWQLLCGRSRFQSLDQITRSTYICSLHFVGGKGPRSDNDEPVLATLTESELIRKQQAQDEESTSFSEPMEDDTKTEETAEHDEDGSSEPDLKDNIKTEEMEVHVFESRCPDVRTVETCERCSIDNVRCFVDCIEFSCATPRDGGQRGRVFSSSKQRTTMKALLAVTPNGAVCFVSDLYGGSASDDHIFEKCGILQHIEPGDVLLLDKGFSVQDLLQSRQATAQTPTFLRQRANPKAAEKTTMRVAQARVHVERFRKRLQKFALLGRTIPRHLCPIASQAVYVGCCLVNFQENLSI
uniref:DDE Tnp4 domain-containing protein n=1 Tax=Knipowitschia caucasica TaxID=637954 RepID=A0AAV2J7E1_KNICA